MLNVSLFAPSFKTIKAILNDFKYDPQQKQTVQRNYKLMTRNKEIFHNAKPINTSLFRHYFIKKKYEELQSVSKVQNLIGHVNPESTQNYIFSELYQIK